MNGYHTEQLDAHEMVMRFLEAATPAQRCQLQLQIGDYLSFRRWVDGFLERHFADVCTRECFTSRRSACCSREGIITFFADTVVNALCAPPEKIDHIIHRLKRPNHGPKCVYLTDTGCMWTLRPIVCAMFLCRQAREAVFETDPSLADEWAVLTEEKKRYTWPDRPVIFDQLEAFFIDAGYESPLMYLHHSPGLLRIKQTHQIKHANDAN